VARPIDRLTLVDLRLPARASALKGAREAVAAAATEFGLDPKRRYEFVFAVNEAVTNAIKHGQPQADGAVGLRIDAAGDELVCSVSDAGPFVHRSDAPRPDGDGGRGIPFMTTLSDHFDLLIEADRTTVRLTKRRLPGPSTSSR
jgi:anti-sigma regulatory factor (Ser/Thr protein kinase)